MRILAFKPGHDGSAALIDGRHLVFSIEAEKDSGDRYAQMDPGALLGVMSRLDAFPDAIVLSGWAKGATVTGQTVGAGYLGLEPPTVVSRMLLGQRVLYLTSSHERSHILSAYALSPYPQGMPCYVLVWEGHIGSFYSVDARAQVSRLADVMVGPGIRYAFVYALADPSFNLPRGMVRLGDAGKLMALSAYASNITATREEEELLSILLGDPAAVPAFHKPDFARFRIYNSGVQSVHTHRLARLITDRIFAAFQHAARSIIQDRRPLLISGGCGLNCEWNRAWQESSLFTETFVPPCANDTGSAVGSAADAQLALTGNAKLSWTVYCGQEFVDDADCQHLESIGPFFCIGTDLSAVASALHDGAVIGWISGRAEMGPRALGNRSLLAAPFAKATLHRLNEIKRREGFRPIAPVCLEEDAARLFDLRHPSRYMLFFARVIQDGMDAVTHVDGSARPQTVTPESNPLLYRLLREFKARSGVGLLCNTSLNFSGKGFINRTSELLQYARETGLDGFAVEGRLFLRRGRPQGSGQC